MDYPFREIYYSKGTNQETGETFTKIKVRDYNCIGGRSQAEWKALDILKILVRDA